MMPDTVLCTGNGARKMLSNHVSFNAAPLRVIFRGTLPSNSSHNSSQLIRWAWYVMLNSVVNNHDVTDKLSSIILLSGPTGFKAQTKPTKAETALRGKVDVVVNVVVVVFLGIHGAPPSAAPLRRSVRSLLNIPRLVCGVETGAGARAIGARGFRPQEESCSSEAPNWSLLQNLQHPSRPKITFHLIRSLNCKI
ncbi:hypothetical protein D0Y65_036099 [Glycine soja]|uniref:Uncharacterized protein n=1 Tax=Glycine soja TaxID=3848 RepID=A0A445HCV0_GLYSO|nr:hypothetical protein D0Y65_036099 [Glycine soja]